MATSSLLLPSPAGGGTTSLVSHGRGGRLKYAEAKDLPSFPSIGIKSNGAAASAAASLGWANRKTFEHWKPDPSASASAAAVLAKDYKMTALWEPTRSEAGFKAAALAAGSAQRHAQNKPEPAPGWGNSAATMAFNRTSAGGNAPPASSTFVSPPGLTRHGSLQAAKGAMAGMRARSSSTPQAPEGSYPDKLNAASNARNAATAAHRPTIRTLSAPDVAGAVPFTNMSRQMFTSNPPARVDLEEKKRADVLHASAVAMAKRMYVQQQKTTDTVKQVRRSSSFTRHGSGSTDHLDVEEPPMQFNNLQEAAYRLAQERLAKLHDEHQKNREFQEYYGSSATRGRGKFGAIQKKLTRRRAASDTRLFEDLKESQRIRRQMSLFNNKLSEVDEKKRARDRAAVLTAARRNVKAQLQGMDQKVYAETGRVTPSVLSSWEQKAHALALLKVDAARDKNAGKVNIGGGRFMDQQAVTDIAAKRIQPLLDEINEKAEVERERQTALKLDEERRKEEAEKKKLREKEVQEINRKLKDEQKEKDKVRKEEAKKEEKTRKEQLKTASAEEPPSTEVTEGKNDAAAAAETAEPISKKALAVSFPRLRTKFQGREKTKSTRPLSPDDAITSPSGKMKTWIKHHFGRPRTKSFSAATDDEKATRKGFVGGAALAKTKDGNNSTASVDKHSVRNGAKADTSQVVGDERGEPSEPPKGASEGTEESDADGAPSIVRSASSLSEEDDFSEAKSQLGLPSAPMSGLSTPSGAHGGETRRDGSAKGSPKGSRFKELIE